MLLESFKDLVITDTGRYDLNETPLFFEYIRQGQEMVENLMDPEMLDNQSTLFSIDSTTFYGDIKNCLSMKGAHIIGVTDSSVRLDLTVMSFDDLLSLLPTNAFTSENYATPLYICRTSRLDSLEGIPMTASDSGYLVYPIPDTAYSLRIVGLFRFTDVLLDLDGTHPLLTTYVSLLILAVKARMEFGLRNLEGYRQYRTELMEHIDSIRRKKIYEEDASESLIMEG